MAFEPRNKVDKITGIKRKIRSIHSASATSTYIVDPERRRNGRQETWKQSQVSVHTVEGKSGTRIKASETGTKKWITEKGKSSVESTPASTAGPQPYQKSTGGQENKRCGKQGKGSRSNQGHGAGMRNRARESEL